MLAASAHPAPVVQGGQAQSILRSVRALSSQAGLAGPLLTYLPRCCLLCGVVCRFQEWVCGGG